MSNSGHRNNPEAVHNHSRRMLLKSAATGAAASAIGALWPALVSAQAGGDTIRIGFPVPLTGPFGSEAQAQIKGAELAIKEFNEAGGLKGRKAELLVRDDKLNPSEAATRTLELIEKDKVHFIVGSLSAAVCLSVNNVTRQRGVIYNYIGQSDTINESKDWSRFTFHEGLNPHMTGGAVARHVFPKYGKRAIILASDGVYGDEMIRAFRTATKSFGTEFVEIIRHPIGHADYSAYFPKILALKPDVLVCANYGRDQLNTFKQATDFGLKNSMKIVTPLMSLSARATGGHEVFKGIIGGVSYYWALEDSVSSAKVFNAKYSALHKTMPTDYSGYGYAGVRAVLAAVLKASSIETEKVIVAMNALKYDIYKGEQAFRKCDNQSVQSVLIVESKDKAEMRNDADTLKIVAVEKFNEDKLRSCIDLGFKA